MTSFLTAGWLCEKAQTVKSAISAAILIAARHLFNGVLAATLSEERRWRGLSTGNPAGVVQDFISPR
jgi:hypothetical protein